MCVCICVSMHVWVCVCVTDCAWTISLLERHFGRPQCLWVLGTCFFRLKCMSRLRGMSEIGLGWKKKVGERIPWKLVWPNNDFRWTDPPCWMIAMIFARTIKLIQTLRLAGFWLRSSDSVANWTSFSPRISSTFQGFGTWKINHLESNRVKICSQDAWTCQRLRKQSVNLGTAVKAVGFHSARHLPHPLARWGSVNLLWIGEILSAVAD